ncbi:MAG: signal peptidase II [Fidelibacterota bacterium]
MKKNQKTLLLILCLLLFLSLTGLDQWSKHRIRSIMPMDNYYAWEDISVFGEWLTFTHVENTGVAFSIPIPLLKYVSLFALLFILFFFYRILKENPDSRINYFSFTLILAGAAGNFIDRFARGQVTDFIKVDLGFWPFNPFAIFNVADSCITVGVFLYLIFTITEEIREKQRNK